MTSDPRLSALPTVSRLINRAPTETAFPQKLHNLIDSEGEEETSENSSTKVYQTRVWLLLFFWCQEPKMLMNRCLEIPKHQNCSHTSCPRAYASTQDAFKQQCSTYRPSECLQTDDFPTAVVILSLLTFFIRFIHTVKPVACTKIPVEGSSQPLTLSTLVSQI